MPSLHPSFIQNQPFYDASLVRKSFKSSCRIAKEDEVEGWFGNTAAPYYPQLVGQAVHNVTYSH